MSEKYGFVYIWRDRKHKRFYVGCHWGREDDGYICSSSWMKKAYKYRPEDFKRRILVSRISSIKELRDIEHYYLNMIKPEEIKVKYYNLRISKTSFNNDKFSDGLSKMKQTNILKYGKEWPSQNITIKAKIKEVTEKNNMQLYGVKSCLSLPEVHAKTIATARTNHHKKYGVVHPMQRKDVAERAKENRKKNAMERYGVDHVSKVPEVKIRRKEIYKEMGYNKWISDTVWITDGEKNRRVPKDFKLEDGWRKGKTHDRKRNSIK